MQKEQISGRRYSSQQSLQTHFGKVAKPFPRMYTLIKHFCTKYLLFVYICVCLHTHTHT